MQTRTAEKPSLDEIQITELLDTFAAALRAKDARAAMACYAQDVVAYDLAPPLRVEAAAMHTPDLLQQWFDTWSSPIVSEGHDLQIAVGGDVAYAHGLRHMTGTKMDGERVDLWFRATAGFRRERGQWKITHVHNSVPFAMDGSGRALLDLKP
jgi:ketosteroid isomerase-like protein